MTEIFEDINRYYAADIRGKTLVVGKIIFQDGVYDFSEDRSQNRFDLDGLSTDITQMQKIVGEIHPRSALSEIVDLEVNSCVYLNENDDSGEIEVRSIHKGIANSIFTKQQCPLIQWNAEYEDSRYFNVIDVQRLFNEAHLKDDFSEMLATNLRDFELLPPLLHLKMTENFDFEDRLHDPRLRG